MLTNDKQVSSQGFHVHPYVTETVNRENVTLLSTIIGE